MWTTPPTRPSRRPCRPTRRGLPPPRLRSQPPSLPARSPRPPRGPLTEELGDELGAAAQGDALVLPAQLLLCRHGRRFPAARFESGPAPAPAPPLPARAAALSGARAASGKPIPPPAVPLGIAIPCAPHPWKTGCTPRSPAAAWCQRKAFFPMLNSPPAPGAVASVGGAEGSAGRGRSEWGAPPWECGAKVAICVCLRVFNRINLKWYFPGTNWTNTQFLINWWLSWCKSCRSCLK